MFYKGLYMTSGNHVASVDVVTMSHTMVIVKMAADKPDSLKIQMA